MSETDTARAASETGAGTPAVRAWRAPEVVGGGHGPLTAARIAEIEEQARREGYQRGLKEGRRDGTQALRQCGNEFEQLLVAMRPQVAVLDDSMLEQLGQLVIAITRQLVRRELKCEPGEIVRVVREALVVLPVTDALINIFLHPDDAALVRRVLGKETPERQVRIIEDVTLTQGGARVETDVSVVDATVEQRIGAIAAQVFGDERDSSAGERRGDTDD